MYVTAQLTKIEFGSCCNHRGQNGSLRRQRKRLESLSLTWWTMYSYDDPDPPWVFAWHWTSLVQQWFPGGWEWRLHDVVAEGRGEGGRQGGREAENKERVKLSKTIKDPTTCWPQSVCSKASYMQLGRFPIVLYTTSKLHRYKSSKFPTNY